MKRVNIIFLLAVVACFCLFTTVAGVWALEDSSVYTLSNATYDEETGDLTYLKVEYSSKTWQTTNVTTTDATGAPVDVSDDAQYVFLPASYEGVTEETTVSIKYRNTGVTYLPMHVEYGAGITADGVDYERGYKYICVDALSSSTWNITFSKSIDGYDVVSILFGNYASEVYDINLLGFRLYFDYSKEVGGKRSFEIMGVSVHESSELPSFASDPKGCRLSSFTNENNEKISDSYAFENGGEIKANILDYSPDYTSIELYLNFSGESDINVILDEESVYNGTLTNGVQTIEIPLTKQNYSRLTVRFSGSGTVKISAELMSKPYVDKFTGKNHSITENENGEQCISYSYLQGWYEITAPIRKYVAKYDSLKIVLNLSHPIVMGILIDDEYLYSHWSNTDPIPAGDKEFFFNLSSVNIGANSVLTIWLDPAITGYAGTEGTKTVIVKEVQFVNSLDMPSAEINIEGEFVFDYNGEGKSVSGATTNSGETLIYEYKRENDPERAYSEDLPVDAGVYDVRITSPLNTTYGRTYAYTKLTINKITPNAPTVSNLTFDFANEQIHYDPAVLAVSKYQDFSYLMQDGSAITYGLKLYYKFIDSLNYNESEVSEVTLNQREQAVTFTIDYKRETTKENLLETQEYSTDGINWTVGQGKKIKVEPGYIYLFRTKATSSAFASEIYYVSAGYRPTVSDLEITLDATDSTSITVKQIQGAEYKLADTVWQTDNNFGYLTEGSKVTVYVRLQATENSFASEVITAEFTVGQMPSEKPDSSSNDGEGGCSSSVALNSVLSLYSLTFALLATYFVIRRKAR